VTDSDVYLLITHSPPTVVLLDGLVSSVKLASICSPLVEQELLHLATQASGFLDRLYPDGRLCRVSNSAHLLTDDGDDDDDDDDSDNLGFL